MEGVAWRSSFVALASSQAGDLSDCHPPTSCAFAKFRQNSLRIACPSLRHSHAKSLIARGKRYKAIIRSLDTDSSEEDMEEEVKKSNEYLFLNDEEDNTSIESIGPPPDFVPSYSKDSSSPLETDEQIAAAYEELYGPRPSQEEEDEKPFLADEEVEKIDDGLEESVLEVRRVSKVTKSGKKIRFRVVVVVGDRKGQVGVGVGKSTEVGTAIRKAARDARREIVLIRITKYGTIPHRSKAKFKAAKVMIRPAYPYAGLRVGGAMHMILDMGGVENALGKQFGSDNLLNNARATLIAIEKMRFTSEIARQFGISVDELLSRECLKRV